MNFDRATLLRYVNSLPVSSSSEFAVFIVYIIRYVNKTIVHCLDFAHVTHYQSLHICRVRCSLYSQVFFVVLQSFKRHRLSSTFNGLRLPRGSN